VSTRYISAKIDPPRRVEIVRSDDDRPSSYFKPGQFGYALSYTTHPGMHTLDKGPTEPGELAFLVSKTKGMRGGGLWFSAEGIRFTKAPPELKQLSDEERVALDLLLEGQNGEQFAKLVPEERRGHLRATAAQVRSLRGR
jgi:hypothetical protein